ncbi:MAG: hypothetical protein F6J90_32985 [Moorea sp. SIOASIH]|uniref:hypothetical protein n=1 Tax=Moorena sp. SIOASIH TaxID=2607817 RepID=UPI0013BC114A|nr:hypothetical protein [Moorena sp. SIOASIH]NEO40891.1 hypothetical protein [Moorena sp. SIOASIH]
MFIHIGYHKTATTFLQQYIFPNHPEIEYWNRHYPKYKWLADIVTCHDFDFNADEIRLKAQSVSSTTKVKLISWEQFSGAPYRGGSDSRIIADRLHGVFPNAKIIISIRNQLDMIDSLYRQYIHQGGGCGFDSFLNLSHECCVYFSLKHLCYDRMINYYQQLFGTGAVFVCLYEAFQASPYEFLSQLFAFMSLKSNSFDNKIFMNKTNQGMSSISIAIARIVNRFVYSPSFNPNPVIPFIAINSHFFRRCLQGYLDPLLFNRISGKRSFISKQRRVQLNDYFRTSNRSLLNRVDLPLKEYNYPL